MSLKQVSFLPSERGKRVCGLVGWLVDLVSLSLSLPSSVCS